MRLYESAFCLEGYWEKPLEDPAALFDPGCVSLFDQNGYYLTLAEQHYAHSNEVDLTKRREGLALRQDWFRWEGKLEGPHLNHSDLFERKGYSGKALEQLKEASVQNPLLNKIIQIRPKWGIDVSIDYASEGRAFELFHYEWDSFDVVKVQEAKKKVEEVVLRTDWERAAEELWARRSEWTHLGFFAQSDWKCDYFGLGPENFKDIIWKC